MKKVMIATPAYENKIHVPYGMSLIDTCNILSLHGFQPVIRVLGSGSLLVADRNRILEMFYRSDCDWLLCLDSDLGWQPEAVLRLLCLDKDFSGGCYPSRDGSGFIFRPFIEEDGKIIRCTETGLLKMEYIPAGFMLIKRVVIEKMRETYPELEFCPKNWKGDETDIFNRGFCLFNTEVWEGEFWGEDYTFCRRARNAGFDIWVDPTIYFNHAGFSGALIQTLTTQPSA